MNLNSLTLQDNQLTSIPAEIGNLTSIKEMNLLDNQFTGEISRVRKFSKFRRITIAR